MEQEQVQEQPGERGDKEQEEGMRVEEEQESMERMENRIPEEQSLIQLRMTGFLNPAPSNQEWPTMDNFEAGWKD